VLAVCVWICIFGGSVALSRVENVCGASLRSGFLQHRDPRGLKKIVLLLIDNTWLGEDNKAMGRSAVNLGFPGSSPDQAMLMGKEADKEVHTPYRYFKRYCKKFSKVKITYKFI
jgi:hypothetical protein